MNTRCGVVKYIRLKLRNGEQTSMKCTEEYEHGTSHYFLLVCIERLLWPRARKWLKIVEEVLVGVV